MFAIELLGDERAKLDAVCDKEEQPVEEHDAVGVARPPMLDILDVEDDEEGDDVDGSGPKAEIPSPDACKVLDLESSLYGSRGDEGSKGNLSSM